MKLFRQGDVMLMQVATLPKGAKETPSKEEGRIVLAYGEVTGHAHAIDSKLATEYAWQGDRLIHVGKKGAQVLHEEHAPVILEEGTYKVIQQREYFPEAIRNVAD
jgi:hypothetical protein